MSDNLGGSSAKIFIPTDMGWGTASAVEDVLQDWIDEDYPLDAQCTFQVMLNTDVPRMVQQQCRKGSFVFALTPRRPKRYFRGLPVDLAEEAVQQAGLFIKYGPVVATHTSHLPQGYAGIQLMVLEGKGDPGIMKELLDSRLRGMGAVVVDVTEWVNVCFDRPTVACAELLNELGTTIHKELFGDKSKKGAGKHSKVHTQMGYNDGHSTLSTLRILTTTTTMTHHWWSSHLPAKALLA